jgi:hypothetical protein
LDKSGKPGLKRPKTWDKPNVNQPKNQVLLSFVSSCVDKPVKFSKLINLV